MIQVCLLVTQGSHTACGESYEGTRVVSPFELLLSDSSSLCKVSLLSCAVMSIPVMIRLACLTRTIPEWANQWCHSCSSLIGAHKKLGQPQTAIAVLLMISKMYRLPIRCALATVLPSFFRVILVASLW